MLRLGTDRAASNHPPPIRRGYSDDSSHQLLTEGSITSQASVAVGVFFFIWNHERKSHPHNQKRTAT
jgi:hypothetical protein